MIIEGTKIEYRGMGLFTTDDTWIHPERTEVTFEIVFVTEGTVYLTEEDEQFTLEKGDLIILDKHKFHFGFKESCPPTSFYWVHISNIPEKFPKLCRDFKSGHLFKELLHFTNHPDSPIFAVEAVIAHIMAEIAASQSPANSLADKIYEWVRINANAKLTVLKTSDHFGYNNEYISRLMRKNYGMGLKNVIDSFIIKKAKELLCNTDYSSKQISAILEFPDPSAFINFFKYHENSTPSAYRNRYTKTHMNKK